MYRTSTTYAGQIWIPQGAIDDSNLRDQKLQVEQWTSRRVPYLGGLPFTDKFVRNWSSNGEGKDESTEKKRMEGEVYDENYVEKMERVEKVGESVQARAENENE